MTHPTQLTPEQAQAAQASGPVVLSASAGSGKTSVLVERYLRALAGGLRPEQILTVTFTRKAGAQLRERILERLAEAPETVRNSVTLTPWIGTLHSFCLQVIRHWGTRIGKDTPGTVVDPLERAELAHQVMQGWLDQLPEALAQALFAHWKPSDLRAMAAEVLAKSHLVRRRLKHSNSGTFPAPLTQALTLLLEQWKVCLEQAERITFDDLEAGAAHLLGAFPEVARHYQSTFRCVLVDEFQDTSPLQWEILSAVSADSTAKLFVVGDPKQSIYRFREADVRLFLQWEAQIAQGTGQVLHLRTCFRSTPELVEAVNKYGAKLFAGSPLANQPMVAAQKPSGETPVVFHSYAGETAAQATLEERFQAACCVQSILDSATAPHEVALLFRNSDRMEGFAAALSARGIPVACEPIAALLSLYEVQDIRAYLQAVADPLDDFHLSAFLRTPYAGMDPARLQALCAKANTRLYEALWDVPELSWFVALVERGETRTQEVLRHLFSATRAWPARGGPFLKLLGGLATAEFLPQALDKLKAWEAQGVAVSAPVGNADPHGVRLMTVHAAKGLEFEHTLLVDCLRKSPTRVPWLALPAQGPMGVRTREGGGNPQPDAVYAAWAEDQRKQEADEAGRTLYVALTRAKKQLHVFIPTNPKLIPKGSWADSLREP